MTLSKEETLILVNQYDQQVGTERKLKVHRDGLLHRAFSIFIFNTKGELMLQRRTLGKYHSGGLWTNTCCGHPRPRETTLAAAHRRLKEEMGFDCHLQEIRTITYQAQVSNNLIEHEFDHIYVGQFDDKPVLNPDEVSDWLCISTPDLLEWIAAQPQVFTVWFIKILSEAGTGCLDDWQACTKK